MRSPASTLSRLLEPFGAVRAAQPVGGGCISEACRVDLQPRDGGLATLFVKSNRADFLENFRCETAGLRQLAEPAAIRVPQPLQCCGFEGQAWFVSEWIESSREGRAGHGRDAFFRRFGRRLARLHQRTQGEAIGLDHDNYLGAARQINQPRADWVRFFQEQRIGFQLRWAVDQGRADHAMQADLERLIDRLPELLKGRDSGTSLLHGDLWSGNYLSDSSGEPVIFDPAIYRGCREAEFGMLQLFGGCPPAFDEAYQEAWPFPAGWQRRVRIYVLYHLLNHLNLFGSGYAGQCRGLTREILAAA
jgi:fructosamine-3-kinase